MNPRYFTASLITALVVAADFTATEAARAESPSDFIDGVAGEGIDDLVDGRLSLEEAERLLSNVDVDAIARFALGRYVHRTDEATYAAYRDALRGHLVDQLQTHLARLEGGDVDVEDTVRRGDNQAIVQTEVTDASGERFDVNWRIRRNDGGWEIIDVEAMGLWLAIEQRAQFAAELDRTGGDVAALTQTLLSPG